MKSFSHDCRPLASLPNISGLVFLMKTILLGLINIPKWSLCSSHENSEKGSGRRTEQRIQTDMWAQIPAPARTSLLSWAEETWEPRVQKKGCEHWQTRPRIFLATRKNYTFLANKSHWFNTYLPNHTETPQGLLSQGPHHEGVVSIWLWSFGGSTQFPLCSETLFWGSQHPYFFKILICLLWHFSPIYIFFLTRDIQKTIWGFLEGCHLFNSLTSHSIHHPSPRLQSFGQQPPTGQTERVCLERGVPGLWTLGPIKLSNVAVPPATPGPHNHTLASSLVLDLENHRMSWKPGISLLLCLSS